MLDSVTIKVPDQFCGDAMTSITRQLVASAKGRDFPGHVCFDFSSLRFVEPAGMVFLSNLICWLRQERGKVVTFSGLRPQVAAIQYLDDCGFFSTHNEAPLRQEASPRQTTIPFTSVKQHEAAGWLDLRFVPWLASRTNKPEAAFAPLRTCMSELLNNIADHTRYDIGGVAAQHFPNANQVKIAIADFGLGIPKSVAKEKPGLSDQEAIIIATQDGFTTRSKPQNRGAGLDYLLRVVPGNGLGIVSIYSGDGIVRFPAVNGGKSEPLAFKAPGYCPGTLIEIDISTDRIEIAEEEDFQW
jgi:anti-sigma regulatory factor (Ser/Thr protein kinase)